MRKFWMMALVAVMVTSCSGGGEKMTYTKVGTGSQAGVYYSAGLALAELVNRSGDPVDLSVESTDGSVFNVNAVLQGELDFGFAQADRQYQATRGLGVWKDNPQENLRFVCSFHTEAVTLIAADDSNIWSLPELRNSTTSIGSAASGTRGNALDLLGEVGLKPEVDFNAEDLKASEASMMLQDRRIDAFFYTVGHPNGSLMEATNGNRKVHFVPITGMEKLLKQSPYYSLTAIPKQLYPKATNKGDVATIGMRTTLVTHADIPEDVVYTTVKSLFEGLDSFKARHPSFQQLTPQEMLGGQFAPLHPGAERYFREAGLL